MRVADLLSSSSVQPERQTARRGQMGRGSSPTLLSTVSLFLSHICLSCSYVKPVQKLSFVSFENFTLKFPLNIFEGSSWWETHLSCFPERTEYCPSTDSTELFLSLILLPPLPPLSRNVVSGVITVNQKPLWHYLVPLLAL